ncbi:hypothetical protein JRQ81_011866 [Phrynocephalus forsythii]|uniref:Membrane progestin receptor alpha n=1 Tax=Phrynocephalus forsythii TaxID=171643 RepID=A0A9Q1AQI8_9SAUR|nr:hypothetical protein JRQ81_011866 [Phrynocephalus forsythii]
MATIVSEKLGHLFLNVQHFRKVPRLLEGALPSSSCTVGASDVPQVFQKPYIHAGYRPLHRTWKYYFLSLFQRHNEAINVWTHLVAALVLVVRFWRLSQAVDFHGDPHTQPLFVVAVSSIIYSTFSALAHLLQAKSEFWHCAFFFLDYVGVATYQYSSALVHYYYAIEPEWHERIVGFYIPGAVLLAWLSCAGSCYAKYRCPHLSSAVEAVLLDYETRRPVYSRLHGSLASLFSALCLLVLACCSLTALYMTAQVKHKLRQKQE